MSSNVTSLGDTCEDWVTLRDGLASSDTPLTDYLGTAIPSHAEKVAGHMRYKIRVVGTNAADEACTIYVGLWPRSTLQNGFLAYKGTVTLGTATTAAHPVTGASSTTYEADTFAVTSATVPYEEYSVANSFGANLIIDVTGEAFLSVQCELGTAATITIYGKAL